MKKRLISFLTLVIFIISINVSTVFAVNASTKDIDKIKEVMDLINLKYKDDVSSSDLTDNAIKGMLKTLDPHSTYFKKEEYENFIESLSDGFSGIGVNIKKSDRYIEIIGIIKDSPAEKVGLKIGDKFFTVDGVSAVDMETDAFVTNVRGEKGTKVKIEIVRDNIEKPILFDITRDSISLSSVEYKVIEKNIGYIKINEFSSSTGENVKKALDEFDKNNVDKIIVDLRGNPGGYLSEAVSIGEMFIPKGPIVHIKEKGKLKETYNSKLEKLKYKLAVLVDGGSASASEIFAGAVQDTKAGTIIGQKTYGKGTVQTFFKLGDSSYVKLTIAKYLTPNERMIDGIGLKPDITVTNNASSKIDRQLRKAISVLR